MTSRADGLELRAGTGEVRTAAGRKLVGLAAVFNTPATIGGCAETIRPGAFAASLSAGDDVRCLVDHDETRLLGRTRSGTLRLVETAEGLAFELDVPQTQLGHDILALAERRDLAGCSFGFRVRPGGEAWPSRHLRELRAVRLSEISVLTGLEPAYDGTTIAARARAFANSARLRLAVLETL